MMEKAQVIDWLITIIGEPHTWEMWYSESEVVELAKAALELVEKGRGE